MPKFKVGDIVRTNSSVLFGPQGQNWLGVVEENASNSRPFPYLIRILVAPPSYVGSEVWRKECELDTARDDELVAGLLS